MAAGVAEDFFGEDLELQVAGQVGDAAFDRRDILLLVAAISSREQEVEREHVVLGEFHRIIARVKAASLLKNGLGDRAAVEPLVGDDVSQRVGRVIVPRLPPGSAPARYIGSERFKMRNSRPRTSMGLGRDGGGR